MPMPPCGLDEYFGYCREYTTYDDTVGAAHGARRARRAGTNADDADRAAVEADQGVDVLNDDADAL